MRVKVVHVNKLPWKSKRQRRNLENKNIRCRLQSGIRETVYLIIYMCVLYKYKYIISYQFLLKILSYLLNCIWNSRKHIVSNYLVIFFFSKIKGALTQVVVSTQVRPVSAACRDSWDQKLKGRSIGHVSDTRVYGVASVFDTSTAVFPLCPCFLGLWSQSMKG